jgi:hypothetical protein
MAGRALECEFFRPPVTRRRTNRRQQLEEFRRPFLNGRVSESVMGN